MSERAPIWFRAFLWFVPTALLAFCYSAWSFGETWPAVVFGLAAGFMYFFAYWILYQCGPGGEA